jgi:hypothetical protein
MTRSNRSQNVTRGERFGFGQEPPTRFASSNSYMSSTTARATIAACDSAGEQSGHGRARVPRVHQVNTASIKILGIARSDRQAARLGDRGNQAIPQPAPQPCDAQSAIAARGRRGLSDAGELIKNWAFG